MPNLPRALVIEVTLENLSTTVLHVDPHYSIYDNVSVICVKCGKLWAQFRYHALDPQTQALKSHNSWRALLGPCSECAIDGNKGGSLYSEWATIVPFVDPDKQPANRDLLMREMNLLLEKCNE